MLPTIPRFLFNLMTGGLITWMLQTNGLTRTLWQRHKLLVELKECDLCLGFWVFLGLGYTLRIRPLGVANRQVEPIIFAFIASFLVHIFRAGLKAKFGYTVV